MSSYRYNVISYSLLLRCAHVVSRQRDTRLTFILTRFIFENRCFSFSFSFRLVKVAKRESETRFEGGRGGEEEGNSLSFFFFFSQSVDKRGCSGRQVSFPGALLHLALTWRGHKRIRHFFLEMRFSS